MSRRKKKADAVPELDYYGELKKLYPPLPQEEIVKLIERAQNNDSVARNEVILRNAGLAQTYVSNYESSVREELFMVCTEAIGEAIDEYDLSRDVSFSTWATNKIKYAIGGYLRKNGHDLFHYSIDNNKDDATSYLEKIKDNRYSPEEQEDALLTKEEQNQKNEQRKLEIEKQKEILKAYTKEEIDIISLSRGLYQENNQVINQKFSDEEIAEKLGLTVNYVRQIKARVKRKNEHIMLMQKLSKGSAN